MRTFTVIAASWFLVGLGQPVHADPITVTSGVVSIDSEGGPFRRLGFTLTGDGFHARGENPDTFPPIMPTACAPAPCPSGTSTALGGIFNPVGTFGSATLNGIEYSVEFLGRDLSFSTGDVVLPPNSETFFIRQSPFTFSGMLDIWALGPSGRFSVGTIELTGRGFATGFFAKSANGYTLTGVTYDFVNPTPEPGSLVLLVTGAAMALRRFRSSPELRG